jgi:hypothetical protein
VDRLLRAGDGMVVVAPRNLGKSWLVLQLASALANGEPFFLGDTWTPDPGAFAITQQANVLLLLGESRDYELYERLKKLKVAQPQPGTFLVDTSRSAQIIVMTEYENVRRNGRDVRQQRSIAELTHNLESTIREHNIAAVFTDPWASFYNGDENSNDQTQRALDVFDQLILLTDIAVIVTHHPSKSSDSKNATPEDTWRGASRLADWADTRLTFKINQGPKQRDRQRHEARRTVDVTILSRGPSIPDFVMTADPDTRRWAINPDEEVSASGTGKLTAERAAAACREAGGFASTKAAARYLGVAQGTAKAGLEAAEHNRWVVSTKGDRGATVWAPNDLAPPTSQS